MSGTRSKPFGEARSMSRTTAKERRKNMDTFRQELRIDDHVISLTTLSKRYLTDLNVGLTEKAAAELLVLNGPNTLTPPKAKSRLAMFLEYIFGGFSALLWMGILLCLVSFTVAFLDDPDTPLDQIYLATVLFLVITITGVFGYYQEAASAAIMETFKKMIPKYATVIRDGDMITVSTENVVLGDIVVLESGGSVPADIRIMECASLKVDNSSITGESDPQPRTVESTDLNPLETCNLAFYGTNIIEGNGKGMVIATGDKTLMGHIAGLTSGLEADTTPMKRELRKFIHIITIIAVIIGSIFFVLSLSSDGDIFKAFIYFIAIIMANVPEGLLVTMTASLTLTAWRMSKKNCLVKNLHAIETLGSTSVICSDKTGTLTQNKMTVSHLCYDHTIIDILSDTYTEANSPTFNLLCRVGILCSRAEFVTIDPSIPIQAWQVRGDASESAVLKCMERCIGNTAEYRKQYTKIYEVPFNSTNKYQLSIHKVPESTNLVLVMKGASERIVDKCSTISIGGEDITMDEQHIKKLKMAMLELGHMGERVLGFADLELPPNYTENFEFDMDNLNFPTTGLRFLGFMSMIDPPRAGVVDAVKKCKTAGIKVVMVTGDHPVTAMAIAKKVGIISAENETLYDISMRRNISASEVTEQQISACKATIVTGTELREMNSDNLDALISKFDEIVFARTSPQQKLLIVEAFQRAGNVVGVTGDGVNDSPALKKADIGIAMGIAGSEVTKEAADMIILDDNFATIVIGIEEGRLIFDNLKKSIAYMLTSNVPEVTPFMMYVILQIPNALSIMAILLIDVGTDLWPGISLAYEKPESNIMERPPRNQKTERLVGHKLLCFTNLNVGLTQSCAGFACYFYTMSEHGFQPSSLIGIAKEWYSEKCDLLDSYNQEWTRRERQKLDRICVSTFFMAIVVTQIADLIICKTRTLSVFHHGMKNNVMNSGICFEVCMAIVVVFCPYLNTLMGFEQFHLYLIWPAIPFAFLIVLFDETRKYVMRNNPGGFLERQIYF